MGGFFDIILLAIFAVFIISRLISVLGRKDFEDEIRPTQNTNIFDMEEGKTIEVPYEEVKDEDYKELEKKYSPEIIEQIKEIRKEDPFFLEKDFISGAKKAFEMIVNAFSKGDKKTLKPLLSEEVYKNFESEIERKEKNEQIEQVTIVGIMAANIKNIDLSKKYAKITVEIVSEQINVLKDKAGNILEGDTGHVNEISEMWTFGRNLNSQDPNWELVNISSSI